MFNNEQGKTEVVQIPEGKFCGGNCSDCRYYESHNKDSEGRGYCNNFGSHYWPSERNGCFRYERE
jgi:hypothetical protein